MLAADASGQADHPSPWNCSLKGATAVLVWRGSDETAPVQKKDENVSFFCLVGGVNGPIL